MAVRCHIMPGMACTAARTADGRERAVRVVRPRRRDEEPNAEDEKAEAEEDAKEAEDAEEAEAYFTSTAVPLEVQYVRGWRCAWRKDQPEQVEGPKGARAVVLRRLRKKARTIAPVLARLPKARRHSVVKKRAPRYDAELRRASLSRALWPGSRGYTKRRARAAKAGALA